MQSVSARRERDSRDGRSFFVRSSSLFVPLRSSSFVLLELAEEGVTLPLVIVVVIPPRRARTRIQQRFFFHTLALVSMI